MERIAVNRNFLFVTDFLLVDTWEEVMEQIAGNEWKTVKIWRSAWGVVVDLKVK